MKPARRRVREPIRAIAEEVRMGAQILHLTSKKYLTHDEMVQVVSCGETCSFRLRIWRGKACPAIVLVSQLAGGPSPSWSSSQAANLIHRVYLGFPAEGMLYFEDEAVLGQRKLFLVEFRVLGQGPRGYLTWPSRHDFDWLDLEDMVGGEVPRGPLAGPSCFSDDPGSDFT
jgi:hypothetical protein